MLMITMYRILEYLEGSDTHHRCKVSDGEVVTKRFSYHEVFGNHVFYHHHMYDNNNFHNSPIYVESTRETSYWSEGCHAYFLVIMEVNENYLEGYLLDGADVESQLDFRCQL